MKYHEKRNINRHVPIFFRNSVGFILISMKNGGFSGIGLNRKEFILCREFILFIGLLAPGEEVGGNNGDELSTILKCCVSGGGEEEADEDDIGYSLSPPFPNVPPIKGCESFAI